MWEAFFRGGGEDCGGWVGGGWLGQARQGFYRRLGFEPLDRPFIYANIRGEHKQTGAA
jgi:hypothetical protein